MFIVIIHVLSVILSKNEDEFLQLTASSLMEARDILVSPAGILPVLFCICGFAHLVYSLLKGRDDSGLILLIVFMIMLILGGCIVPSVFLPKEAVMIGEHLPAYFWREDIFSGGALRELVMGVVLFTGGEVLSWVRT